jgi:hypothetical protein
VVNQTVLDSVPSPLLEFAVLLAAQSTTFAAASTAPKLTLPVPAHSSQLHCIAKAAKGAAILEGIAVRFRAMTAWMGELLDSWGCDFAARLPGGA